MDYMFGGSFMNKELQNKLIEISSFVVCFVIVCIVVSSTGVLKNFQGNDLDSALKQIETVFKGNSNSKASPTSVGSKNDISKLSSYQPNRIPDSVLRGAEYSGVWTNLFSSPQKIVFYIYDNNSTEFNNKVQNYVLNNGAGFTLKSYEQQEFINMRAGSSAPQKMCNSLEECNRQRQNASDYASTATFLKMCGNTICVINPAKRQFVRLNTKNSGAAINMIQALKDW